MPEEHIREALTAHWQASAAGDIDKEHETYADDAICDYRQSSERIQGPHNLQSLRGHHPGKPSGFNVKRISGAGTSGSRNTQSATRRTFFTVSMMEFPAGKVVHETQYFAEPFPAPA
jgi:hypothetical protein